MEGLPFLGLLGLLASGTDSSVVARGFSFAIPFFDENLYLMMAMSGVFATLRVIGAIGLLKNRMWGYALSVVNCSVTMALMVFMLPAGIADGLLSGSALILLFHTRYGTARIIE